MFSGNFVIFQTKIFFISILSDYRKVNKLKNRVGNVECSVIGEKTSARLLLFLSIFAEEYFLSLEYLVVIATNGFWKIQCIVSKLLFFHGFVIVTCVKQCFDFYGSVSRCNQVKNLQRERQRR
jgi:hypothetical protein